MSDLDSLRPVIADILDGLAVAYGWPCTEAIRKYDGATTLRWTHAFETTLDGDESLELEHLRELVGGIESVLEETNRNGKPTHPGSRLTKIKALIGDDD
jgi:hypothetical protein